MAIVKNFGLQGVGSELQLGKGGVKLFNDAGVFSFRQASGAANALANISALDVTATGSVYTDGNVYLNNAAGRVNIGDVDALGMTGGYPTIYGNGAVYMPTGTTVQRPTGAVGMIRVNNTTPSASTVEYYNGTAWSTLATGGSTATLQSEIDAIETSLGGIVDASGVYQPSALTNTAIWGTTTNTDLTSALNNLATYVDGKNTLDEIFPATGAGNVIYADAGNNWVQGAPGATSGVQAYSAKLQSLATNATNGLIAQDSSGSVVARSLVAPTEGITISNADGVSGNPTFALANDLAGVEGLTTYGFAVRTADNTWATRDITGSSGRIVVTNGDGIASSPTIDLDTVTQATTGDFVKVTLDGYGRVTGHTAVTTGDITALVDNTYVNVTGDTMTGSLDFGGSYKVTGLADPTAGGDAANKSYVDNAVAGLTWKEAAELLSTDNVALGGPTASLTIDGYGPLTSAKDGYRVVLIGQTTATENGIYVYSDNGTAYTLTRSADADTYQELKGATVFILEGDTKANTGWTQSNHEITSFDGQTWVQFSGAGAYSGSGAVAVSGTVISVTTGNGLTQTGDTLTVNLVSNTALQFQAGALNLVLDGTGGLEQSATGLKISAGGVTNAMLANSSFTLDADSGTGSVSLGGTLNVVGTAAQGIVTSTTGGDITITANDATDASSAAAAQKGVASFDSNNFTSTAGYVTLKTVDTAHGGTGLTSFVANEVFYAGTTSTMDQSANFTFDGTSTLAVGGALPLEINGATGSITATATNSDIVLMPNGTGSVVVGPVGAGLIQSDAGTALTVLGNTGLTIDGGTGAVTVGLPTGTSSAAKVTVSGPTAADYATNLGANDLTNKQYVDSAIQTGAASGSIKAVKLAGITEGYTNIGAAMPAGATVLSVKVVVTTPDATGSVEVGNGTDAAAYMTSSENDASTAGIYMAETYVTEASSTQVLATVTGTGVYTVIVEYQVA